MAILDVFRRNGNGDASALRAELREAEATVRRYENSFGLAVEQLREGLYALETDMQEVGWQRMSVSLEQEFTREGLDKIVDLSRVMFLKNPLIRRSVMVQTYYVFGQGVTVKARDERVNEVVQGFWDDPKNRTELSAHTAREGNEQALQTDGNLFFPLFTDPRTGKVTVRLIPVEEIRDVVCNPQDRGECWYYRRTWVEEDFDLATGRRAVATQREAYYPDWRIYWSGPVDAEGRTIRHPNAIGGVPVELVPVMHVRAGGLRHMRFGIPDVYAALDWARAYKTFLENWHSIVASLSRFAWRLTLANKAAIGPAKAKLSSTASGEEGETNPPATTGGVWLQDPNTKLDPIPKTGATISADDARALRTMVAAATDIPDTILAGDPDMGNLATAKTLDRPTELAMRSRQMLWQDVYRDMASFVVEADLRAVSGRLPRTRDLAAPGGVKIGNVPDGDKAGEPIDGTIDVSFPPVLEQDRNDVVKAIVSAATLDGKTLAGTLPDDLVSRLLLTVLEVENVDELVDELMADMETPDDELVVNQERELMTRALGDLRAALRSVVKPSRVVLHEAGAQDAVDTGAVMVAFFLPAEAASELAVPGGERPEDLHLTLAFLGTIEEMGPDRLGRARQALRSFAATEPVLRGATSGVGRFTGMDPEPVWASLDVVGLDAMRQRLVQALRDAGVPIRSEHGFTPHVSLAFVPPGEPSPVLSVPEVALTIDRLVLAVGGDRVEYGMRWEGTGALAGLPA